MIMKFEDTEDSGVLPGIGRKLVGTETLEEVSTAVVERASSSRHMRWRFRGRQYEKILRYILKWFSFQIHVMQTLNGTGGSFNHNSRDFFESFSPNRFPTSFGQHTRISSIFKFHDHLPQTNP
ncbi:hypothetical protein TNCV_4264211 [Trichonephila clavipes]|nr:hypothetical protein TNCV_4264211 [Trichonephila clavipes]